MSNLNKIKKNLLEKGIITAFGQKGIFLDYLLQPDSPQYNIGFAFEVTGNPDYNRLIEAVNLLVFRHRILRTSYRMVDDEVYQQEEPFAPGIVSFEEILDKANLTEIVQKMHNEPFSPEKGKVFRVNVLKTGDDKHIFLFSAHHIACELWSMIILWKEFVGYYEKTSLHLPPLDEDYYNFSVSQRKWSESSSSDRMWQFWKNKLKKPWPDAKPFTMLKGNPSGSSFYKKKLDGTLVKKL